MPEAHSAALFTARCKVDQRAGNRRRRANGHRRRAHHRVVQLTHRQRPHQQVNTLRTDWFAAGGHVIQRLGDKRHFRGVLTLGCVFKPVNQAHAQRTVCADGFEHGQGFRVAVDVVLQFSPGVPHVPCIDEDRRNARIDQGHVQSAHARYFQIIHQITGRKHRAARPFFVRRRIEELKLHLSGRKRYAIQLKITGFLHRAVGYRHMSNNRFTDVGLPDSHYRDAVLRDARRIHQTAADGKRADRSREVAAVAAPVDKRFVDGDLAKQVVHIVIGVGTFAHDYGFAGAGGRGAHTVDLFFIRVGAADNAQQQGISRGTRHLSNRR